MPLKDPYKIDPKKKKILIKTMKLYSASLQVSDILTTG